MSLLSDIRAPAETGLQANPVFPEPIALGGLSELMAALAALSFRYTGVSGVCLEFNWTHPSGDPLHDAKLELEVTPGLGLCDLADQAERAVRDLFRSRTELGVGECFLRLTSSPEGSAGCAERSESAENLTVTISGAALAHGDIGDAEFHPVNSIPHSESHWQRAIESVRAGSAATVSEFALLDGDESDKLHAWSRSALELRSAADLTLHEIFERTAQSYPDRIALECGAARISYRELEERSNQLARELLNRGVGPGYIVGLLLPASIDFYVGMLAVLKAGAAYLPLDLEYPPDRLAFILADCQARFLLAGVPVAWAANIPATSVLIFAEAARQARQHAASPLSRGEVTISPADLCYVIYTSGSTGRPKGVMVAHPSVCNLVQAEQLLFKPQSSDRVFQAFSAAFDASVESIWLALASGATLVIGTTEETRDTDLLARRLAAARVTIFSSVPTLVSMLDAELPNLRLLILGGESCPPELVQRWAQPGRRIVNTYGPTEATVIATAGDCVPGQLVTIGRPVPNYETFILDRNLGTVPVGVPGELCIAGVGLAQGYLGRPELTRERFVAPPPNLTGCSRIYRTGDLARWNPDGEIEFLGRIDTQVKLRGFRIELAEIEAVLIQHPKIRSAAVALAEPCGLPQLIAVVVPKTEGKPDPAALRKFVQAKLPAYMVPAAFHFAEALPTLASGKIDRKQLAAIVPTIPPAAPIPGGTSTEVQVASLWQRFFPGREFAGSNNFFSDLGGHSLLAAQLTSELRAKVEFRSLAIGDLYAHPTLEQFARKLDQLGSVNGKASHEENDLTRPVSRPKHAVCGAAQFLSLYFVLGFASFQWLGPYLGYTWLVEEGYEKMEAIAAALLLLVGILPLMLLISIGVKWTVIGRFKPGRYPLWGWQYFRFWFVKSLLSAVPTQYLAGTPLLNIYFRLLGAKIGANVFLGSDDIVATDLINIGADSSIGADAALLAYTVEDGWLKLDRISVGRNCFVGTRAVLAVGSSMDNESALEDLSMLPAGSRIPSKECWEGSPARRMDTPPSAPLAQSSRPGFLRRFLFGWLHLLGVAIFPVLVIAAIMPGIILMNVLNYADDYYSYLFYSPMVALSFVVLLALEIAAVKWLFLGKVRPGCHRIFSWFYFRKWLVDQTMELSLDFLGPLYASIYLPPWYRLLGAKLGKRAEISTASLISPDLLTVGEESFVADSVTLGAARFQADHFSIGENRLGKRAFIGNSALLPPQTLVGDNALIGCLSKPPANRVVPANSSWVGSPALFLPQRQESASFSSESTFTPSQKLRAQRAAIEFVRVILPSTGFVVLTSLLLSAVVLIQESVSLTTMLLLFPILYAGAGILAAGSSILAKWILIGRYRPAEKPLWCSFVWRNELINALHENFADLFLIGMLRGTPFINWYFRLLGAKIGRRVYMDTSDVTEFDLVHVQDEAMLNHECTLQTHLFEDRVMKMSELHIGGGCKVGAFSLVLYDTEMQERSSLGPLSLLMKGEVFPPGTAWEGSPAQPQGRNKWDAPQHVPTD